MRIGFVNGCFDGLHTGHRFFLREARKHCDWLIVAVNSDDSVRRLKGEKRPGRSLAGRLNDIYMAGFANAVIPFEGDPAPLIRAIQPHVLIRGEDQTLEGSDEMPENSSTVRIPRLHGYSTTQILQSHATP